MTGYTHSFENTFPVTVGPDLTFNSSYGLAKAFVAKVGAGAPPPDAEGITDEGFRIQR